MGERSSVGSEGLAAVRRYVEMRDAQPLKDLGDSIHAIHIGTKFAAELHLHDLRAILALVPDVAKPSSRPSVPADVREALSSLSKDDLIEELIGALIAVASLSSPPPMSAGVREARLAVFDECISIVERLYGTSQAYILNELRDARIAALSSEPAPDVAQRAVESGLQAAINSIPSDMNWLIGKGKTRPNEPLFGVQLLRGLKVAAETENDDLCVAIREAIAAVGEQK